MLIRRPTIMEDSDRRWWSKMVAQIFLLRFSIGFCRVFSVV